jgi:hypothetical protein
VVTTHAVVLTLGEFQDRYLAANRDSQERRSIEEEIERQIAASGLTESQKRHFGTRSSWRCAKRQSCLRTYVSSERCLGLRTWGKLIRHHDGQVVREPIPWQS